MRSSAVRFLLNVNLLGDLSADAGRSPSHCVGPAGTHAR